MAPAGKAAAVRCDHAAGGSLPPPCPCGAVAPRASVVAALGRGHAPPSLSAIVGPCVGRAAVACAAPGPVFAPLAVLVGGLSGPPGPVSPPCAPARLAVVGLDCRPPAGRLPGRFPPSAALLSGGRGGLLPRAGAPPAGGVCFRRRGCSAAAAAGAGTTDCSSLWPLRVVAALAVALLPTGSCRAAPKGTQYLVVDRTASTVVT